MLNFPLTSVKQVYLKIHKHLLWKKVAWKSAFKAADATEKWIVEWLLTSTSKNNGEREEKTKN